MKRFSQLLDRLVLTPSRNAKLQLLIDYFAHTPDPDRGYALAALTGNLEIASVKPAMLRAMMAERMDEVLFGLSYDYVGDLAETIALVWDSNHDSSDPARVIEDAGVSIATIVPQLQKLGKADAQRQLSNWLDILDSSGRFALLKLLTGGLRIGVSTQLTKLALAQMGQVDFVEIEELWHGLTPPYVDLFAWLEGREEKPAQKAAAPFRSVMLANPLSLQDREKLDPGDYAAEWKWDGIRIQAVAEAGTRRLYSRTGDDIGRAFPDLLDAMDFEAALDGELLVGRLQGAGGPEIASFGELQQRLNRKSVPTGLLESHPVIMRVYDVLDLDGENRRQDSFRQRRAALEELGSTLKPDRFDLSPLVEFQSWDDLARLRDSPPHPVIEGLMVKHWDAPYAAGRPKGPWFKWKRDPMLVDAVLMYAQRGHGRRSSFYSDYTFGVWTADDSLVPVGKAYFGFTDEELKQIDKFVRDNTEDRFGPVRAVTARPDFGLVLEVAFEGLNHSKRHKSGIAMRFPRISRLRWDKPPGEADSLDTLLTLLS
ncbi:MAG: cisplatin damage response ATP-dependent DNA ligase [Rhizobiaceae bacterium]